MGIASLYDRIDASSRWLKDQMVWRHVAADAGDTSPSRGHHERINAFAAYVQATWLVALADSEILQVGNLRLKPLLRHLCALQLARIPWGKWAFRLLLQAVARRAVFNVSRAFVGCELEHGVGTGPICINDEGRPTFEDSLLGHYLHHKATFP